MNRERFEERMEKRWGRRNGRSHGGVWVGFLLCIVGGLLLLKAANVLQFPHWFFSWPVLLIVFGLLSGIKHKFRGGFWALLILAGAFILSDRIDPTLDLARFTWPVVLFAAGLLFIFRPKRRWERCMDHQNSRWQGAGDRTTLISPAGDSAAEEATIDRRDFIDITSVFGGVKKNVLSKTFKGGDIVSFMGGSEIDLTQADFSGTIKIDTTNIFGGTKLIVPPTWDVQSDVTAVFGGVDDKRKVQGVTLDPDKVLILDGTCMFGGIEIRSF